MPPPSLGAVLRHVRQQVGGEAPADRALLQHFLATGDAAAFEQILRRHGPLVLGVCRRLLRDPHLAEDAFQATFLVLVRKAAGLAQPERLGPWLHGVAHRVATRARRHAGRFRPTDHPLDSFPCGAAPSPDFELRDLLDRALLRLPARHREVLILCYLQGLSQSDAARLLGCPLGTVATRVNRGLAALRRALPNSDPGAGGAGAGRPGPQGLTPVPPLALLAETARTALLASGGGPVPAPLEVLAKGFDAMHWMRLSLAGVLLVTALGVGASPPPGPLPAPLRQAAGRAPAGAARAENPEDGPATTRTANFLVTAPTRRVAALVAGAAERERAAAAQRWLGRRLKDWATPCPVQVELGDSSSGATSFAFDRGTVRSREMRLTGPLDRLLASTIPHEVTHTVLADHFRAPLPRWADEGAAVLAEEDSEQERHARMARSILQSPGRAIPLRRLLPATSYPQDVMALYAEGYTLTRFLVRRKDHKTFLGFLRDGLDVGWDRAAGTHYGFADVDALEAGWLADLSKAAPRPEGPPPPSAGPTSPRSQDLPRTAPLLGAAWVEDGRVVRGQPRPLALYLQFPDQPERGLSLTEVRAVSPGGKAIDPHELARRMRTPTPVLVATEGRPVDPFHLRLVKDDAVILLLPGPPPPPARPRRPGGNDPGSVPGP